MGCCCSSDAKWKREVINDHKFDYVDVDEFRDDSFLLKFKYMFVFILTLKSVLIYVLDIYTAVMLIAFNSWNKEVKQEVHFRYTRWIFVASIAASYILVFFEFKKAHAIVRSRDISFAFTSIIANRYYTLHSYSHYCFFDQIHSHKRFKDDVAFFVFFALKGWKRFLFAEAPRQVVNGYTLVRLFMKGIDLQDFFIFENILANISLITMGVPFLLFVVSAIRTLIASLLYIPLVCQIRGNLKEYCCHKIDKRVAELLRIKSHKRAMRDEMLNGTLQPTKPIIEGIDEVIMTEGVKSAGGIQSQDEKAPTLSDCTASTIPKDIHSQCASQLSLLSGDPVSSDQRGYTIAANREYRTIQQQQARLAKLKPTLPDVHQLFCQPPRKSDDTGARHDYIKMDYMSSSGSEERLTSPSEYSNETNDYRRATRSHPPPTEVAEHTIYDLDDLPNRYQDGTNRSGRAHRPPLTVPRSIDAPTPKFGQKGAVNF